MAASSASAAPSLLTSFFHNLTSLNPSVASSCDNQIPNRTTASASDGGPSTTCRLVVDDSIPAVVDVSLPINDGAIRTLNAFKTRTTTTVRSSFNSSRPRPVHPIASLFQRQELGKAVLGFAVPMTTGLLLNQYQGLTHLQAREIAIALSVGLMWAVAFPST